MTFDTVWRKTKRPQNYHLCPISILRTNWPELIRNYGFLTAGKPHESIRKFRGAEYYRVTPQASRGGKFRSENSNKNFKIMGLEFSKIFIRHLQILSGMERFKYVIVYWILITKIVAI